MEPSAARAHLGIAADTFLLLIVSRLVDWKGVDTVIAAMPDLPPRFRLAVVGEGPMATRLRELTKSLGVGDRVRFAGRADRQTVERYLRAADLLILNSLYEGLSHVLLEAMRSGLPILASDPPGTRELIRHGDNGHLFPYNDKNALGQGIELLASDPDRRSQFRQRARLRLEEIEAQHGFDRLEQALARAAGS
jgi:1,4-alpha-glucan branching enzyme